MPLNKGNHRNVPWQSRQSTCSLPPSKRTIRNWLCNIRNQMKVSIVSMPQQLLTSPQQLADRLKQLRNVDMQLVKEQRYVCWLLYWHKESQHLRLEYMTKSQLRKKAVSLDSSKALIGTFIIRQLLRIEAATAYARYNPNERIEEKTTKTTMTNNTQITVQSMQPRKKSKGHTGQKVKSHSLKGDKRNKSHSNKDFSGLKRSKNKSSSHIRQVSYGKLNNGGRVVCFQENILKKKIKEDSRKPALYKKKMELLAPIRQR